MPRLLVTGGSGFIGSNFIRSILQHRADCQVVNLDALTYAGNPANLQEFESDARYRFIHGRIEDPAVVREAMTGIEAVVHFAAESHVDRSIADAAPFIITNVLGTQVLLDAAHKAGIKRFVHVSTDEVYGALGAEGKFTEATSLRPRSPYAASKAAGDMLAQAYWETYRLPVMVVRPSNNYGPYQFPEKLVPVMVTNLVEGRKVPVYGRGENVRDWLHVEDCCRAIGLVLDRGKPGEAYNIGGESERHNIDVAKLVVELMGLTAQVKVKAKVESGVSATVSTSTFPDSWIEYVPDRPGHDFRYALENTKIERELGWRPEVRFEDGLRDTVAWYREHATWWQPLKQRLSRESKGFWTDSSSSSSTSSSSAFTSAFTSSFHGVRLDFLAPAVDPRGWLTELFRADVLQAAGMGEAQPMMAYLTVTLPGATRGPHEHRVQTDFFALTGPSDFEVTLWDNRPGSPTFGRRETHVLGGSRPATLVVPPGVVHALRNVGEVEGWVLNFPNRLYKGPGRKNAVDEIRYEDDPAGRFKIEER